MEKVIKELIKELKEQTVAVILDELDDDAAELILDVDGLNAEWNDLKGFCTFGQCISYTRDHFLSGGVIIPAGRTIEFKLNSKFSRYLKAGYYSLENPEFLRTLKSVIIHEFTHSLRKNKGAHGGHDDAFYKLGNALTKALNKRFDVDLLPVERFITEDESALFKVVDITERARWVVVAPDGMEVYLFEKLERAVAGITEDGVALRASGYNVYKDGFKTFDLEGWETRTPDCYSRSSLLEAFKANKIKVYTKIS